MVTSKLIKWLNDPAEWSKALSNVHTSSFLKQQVAQIRSTQSPAAQCRNCAGAFDQKTAWQIGGCGLARALCFVRGWSSGALRSQVQTLLGACLYRHSESEPTLELRSKVASSVEYVTTNMVPTQEAIPEEGG